MKNSILRLLCVLAAHYRFYDADGRHRSCQAGGDGSEQDANDRGWHVEGDSLQGQTEYHVHIPLAQTKSEWD